MRLRPGRKLIVGGVAALAVAGGGAAFAATQLDSPSARSQAIIDDAAQRLGVQSGALSDALKKAIEDQVDAAVTAGEITKAQGDAIKSRIESGDFPIFGGGPGFGPGGFGLGRGHVLFGFFGSLSTASDYLGVTRAELRSQLMSGKTLAQIAKEKGKSVDGLVSALVEAAKKQIDQAVKAGRLTQDEATRLESDIRQRITDLVNGTRPTFGHGMFGRGFPGFDRGPGDHMWGGLGIWRNATREARSGTF